MALLYGTDYTRRNLEERAGSMDQFGGVRRVDFADGGARGARVAEVRTGSGLDFTVSLDRCMDITNASFRGVPLCWRSPVGDLHPALYEPEGAGWLRTFAGGLLATCGLTTVGSPSEDDGESLGVHGRIGAAPASRVNIAEWWDGDIYRMALEGEMREASVFGPNLRLSRRIATSLGSSGVLIRDTVENLGYRTEPFMILYHFNLGWPIVSEDSRVLAPARTTRPRDAEAAKGADRWSGFEAPTPGYAEQVFYHDLETAVDGSTCVAIVNEEMKLGLSLRFRISELPRFIQWKMMGQGTYVCGMEPANCYVTGRADARAEGELEFLEPGETRTMSVEFGVVLGDEVDALRAEIEGIG